MKAKQKNTSREQETCVHERKWRCSRRRSWRHDTHKRNGMKEDDMRWRNLMHKSGIIRWKLRWSGREIWKCCVWNRRKSVCEYQRVRNECNRLCCVRWLLRHRQAVHRPYGPVFKDRERKHHTHRHTQTHTDTHTDTHKHTHADTHQYSKKKKPLCATWSPNW